MILLMMGYPVFFRQERLGQYGKPFTITKFRTMTEAVDEKGQLLPDEQRLTCLGKCLRMLSLDELPQLFNILIGEMSFIDVPRRSASAVTTMDTRLLVIRRNQFLQLLKQLSMKAQDFPHRTARRWTSCWRACCLFFLIHRLIRA